MNKKILVSDYDHTFYINDEDIEKNKLTVAEFRKQGNLFIIATGRSFYDLYHKVDQYHFDFDLAILNHGATIIDKENNVLSNIYMDDEIIKPIENDLQLEKTIQNFCCSELESRVDFNHDKITKINAKYNEREEAIKINEIINEKYSNSVNSYHISKSSIEIISNKANKSKAIQFLINRLNVPKENVYTIGDGYSDVQMVKDFNGYAMEKSVDKLKSVAKKEVNSVSELIKEIM